MDQAMSIERIAILGFFQMILQALLSCYHAHPVIHRRGLLETHTIFVYKNLVDGFTWSTGSIWVKLVATPDDLNLITMLKASQCGFNAALADITPRTDDI